MSKKSKTSNKSKGNFRPNSNDPKRRNQSRNKYEAENNTKTADKCEPSTQNDASWYSTPKALLNDAGRLSFNNPLGVNVPIYPKTEEIERDSYYFPGICAIPLIVGPGTTTDTNSAVNIAARNMYSFVRHANSGHSNYDPADLMMYLLACDSAFQWYATLVRLYGTAMFYSVRNRYYGRALLTAQGFDPDEVINHLADLRYTINKLVRQLGTLCVPADLAIFRRHAWLYSGIYLDSDDVKAQMYMFRAAGYHFYDEYSGAGKLDYIKWAQLANKSSAGGNLMNFDDIVAVSNDFVRRLMESEDIGIISGDILKAYGKEKLLTLSMVPDDFTVVPAYSAEVLSQIRNATINGVDMYEINGTKLDITQDVETGSVLWEPTFMSSAYEYINSQAYISMDTHEYKLLDMHSDVPSPDEVMVATRLTTITEPLEVGTATDVTVACGTEFACKAQIFVLSPNGDVQKYECSNIVAANDTLPEFMGWTLLTKFVDHPKVDVCFLINSGEALKVYPEVLGDVDNYTVVSLEELRKMHDVAILSMWSVPELGLYKA